MNITDDKVVRKSLAEARATIARTKYINVSEQPLVVYEKSRRRPEREEPSRSYKLDTNITAAVEQRCDYLEGKLAEILPSIASFMENVARDWGSLKSSNEKLVKANEELQKKISEMARHHALDIRSVELAWQQDLLSLRQERLPGKRREPAS